MPQTLDPVEYAAYVEVIEDARRQVHEMTNQASAVTAGPPLAAAQPSPLARNKLPIFLIKKIDAEIAEVVQP